MDLVAVYGFVCLQHNYEAEKTPRQNHRWNNLSPLHFCFNLFFVFGIMHNCMYKYPKGINYHCVDLALQKPHATWIQIEGELFWTE